MEWNWNLLGEKTGTMLKKNMIVSIQKYAFILSNIKWYPPPSVQEESALFKTAIRMGIAFKNYQKLSFFFLTNLSPIVKIFNTKTKTTYPYFLT